jgi:hypothetical protein
VLAHPGQVGGDTVILLHAPVYLWLDDLRPAPKEWRWCKTVAEAIEVMQTEDVEAMSLDHDLDDYTSAGGSGRESTGLDFVDWMVEHNRWPAQKPVVHSANPVGRQRMKATIDRYWQPPRTP